MNFFSVAVALNHRALQEVARARKSRINRLIHLANFVYIRNFTIPVEHIVENSWVIIIKASISYIIINII